MRRAALLGGLAAGLCLLTGCGFGGNDGEGGEREPEPAVLPSGWIDFRGAGYAFGRPRDFAPLPTTDRPKGELLMGFERPPDGEGLPSQVGLGVDETRGDSLADAVRLATQESEVAYPGYRILRRSTPVISGGSAVRVDAEYDSFGGDPVKVRTVDLYVQTKGGRRMNLFARGPLADFDRLGLARAPDTFRLR